MNKKGIGAIVLAAGASTRFGITDKLWHEINGSSLIQHVLKTIKQVSFTEVVVVGSQGGGRLQDLAQQLHIGYVQNPNADDGMGTSISAGMVALNADEICGVAIFLGDMPLLKSNEIGKLVTTFRLNKADKIVRPIFKHQSGHPVFFPASLFRELASLKGDSGAKSVIQRHGNLLETVDSNSACIHDIDSIGDLP